MVGVQNSANIDWHFTAFDDLNDVQEGSLAF